MPDNSMNQGSNTASSTGRAMRSDATTGHSRGNPYHDPRNGQFTSGPASGTAGPANAPESSGDEIVVTASKAARDAAQTANFTQGKRPPRALHVEPRNLLATLENTGKLSASDALAHAAHAAEFRDMLIRQYKLPVALATALAASAELESGLDHSITQMGKNGHGQGIFQLTDQERKDAFKTFTKGTSIENSTADQQINYQIFELSNTERHKYALALQVGTTSPSLAAGYSYYVERPYLNFHDSADRYAVASALDHIPIK